MYDARGGEKPHETKKRDIAGKDELIFYYLFKRVNT
jgi:hypothetical protein